MICDAALTVLCGTSSVLSNLALYFRSHYTYGFLYGARLVTVLRLLRVRAGGARLVCHPTVGSMQLENAG